MKTKGTPTVWSKQCQGPEESRHIIGPEVGADPGRFIARMDSHATDEEWSLIAAAPELLAALVNLIALAEEGLRNRESDAKDGVKGAQDAYDTGYAEIAAADAAIAKATGEEDHP